MIRRSSPPRRRSPLARSTTPIKKVNVARKAKRRKSYAQKLAAYKRSETCKLVEARSGGQCEYIIRPSPWSATQFAPTRCDHFATDHHHKTYARFGGNERLEDIAHLCQGHHAYAESLHPTRNRNYRR